jgi:addiction module RelE/StbE family toxin
MKVRWTAEGSIDRATIRRYIAEDNPEAALRMDELLGKAAAQRTDFPHLGQPGKLPGTRELIPHRSYRLVYEIRGDEVLIMGVIHTSRLWPPPPE